MQNFNIIHYTKNEFFPRIDFTPAGSNLSFLTLDWGSQSASAKISKTIENYIAEANSDQDFTLARDFYEGFPRECNLLRQALIEANYSIYKENSELTFGTEIIVFLQGNHSIFYAGIGGPNIWFLESSEQNSVKPHLIRGTPQLQSLFPERAPLPSQLLGVDPMPVVEMGFIPTLSKNKNRINLLFSSESIPSFSYFDIHDLHQQTLNQLKDRSFWIAELRS
jgi:hypothetical protein